MIKMLDNKEVILKTLINIWNSIKSVEKMSETLLVEDKQTALTSLRGGLTMNTIFVYLQNKRLDVRLSKILNY